jgi:hypothetical protein
MARQTPRTLRLISLAAAAAAAAAVVVSCVSVASAQSTVPYNDRHMMLKPWEPDAYLESSDRIVYQEQGHLKDEDAQAHIYWDNSSGRLRFTKQDERPFTIGYLWNSTKTDSDSPRLPDHLDDIALTAGVPLGDAWGGRLAILGGAGYSGDRPFANEHGLYGIGHLTWERPLSQPDSIVLSLDYNGNSLLFPDAPLPGISYIHRGEGFEYGLGFPDNWLTVQLASQITAGVSYTAPFNGDTWIEYHFDRHVSVIAGYSNVVNAFAFEDEPVTDRTIYQMSRVGGGVHYSGKVAGFDFDVALLGGYAFEQNWYHGYDARNLDRFTSISDEPYVSVILIGKL